MNYGYNMGRPVRGAVKEDHGECRCNYCIEQRADDKDAEECRGETWPIPKF